VTNEEKVINEISERYGSVIDLKKNPHVITEIIRQYAGRLGAIKAECLPPGGPPSRAAAAE